MLHAAVMPLDMPNSLLTSSPNSNPQRTRSSPHSIRIPLRRRSNSTASQDKPSSTHDPSSASAGAAVDLVDTASVPAAGSTSGLAEAGRRMAVGRIGVEGGRSSAAGTAADHPDCSIGSQTS
jgi:hypothetical protein